jgi:hypothetical protein
MLSCFIDVTVLNLLDVIIVSILEAYAEYTQLLPGEWMLSTSGRNIIKNFLGKLAYFYPTFMTIISVIILLYIVCSTK